MSSKTSRARRVFLSTLASMLACVPGPIALAAPQGAQVVAGSAVVSTSGNTTQINQSTNRAIINWNTFSINPNETVNFALPSSSSAVLNRVTTLTPSLLNGTLQSNGAVYLINPSGIIVGPHGVINTQGFLASALDVNNHTFMAGGDMTFSGDSTASVVNQGVISTPSGDVTFLAQQVRNDGTISAPGGSVNLVAGNQILLQQAGTPGLTVKVLGGNGTATNTGLIQTTMAQLAANGGNALALAINNTGVIRATDVNHANGRIVLTAGASGEAENSGTLDVSSATGKGGQITVTGQDIMIDGSSHLTANGASGGGSILIGGSWQNNDPTIAQAVGTVVQSGALLEASATQMGDGGTIVVRSDVLNPDSVTRANGTLLANAGPLGGNGGNIETSGHWLDTAGGIVSASAPAGNTGQWLLDPFDVVISALATANVNEGASPWVPTATGANILNTDINTALNAGTSVTIATTGAGAEAGNITVNAAITKSAGGTPATLRLEADNNILVNQSITSTSNALNVVLDADFDANQQGNIQIVNSSILTNGGAITLGGGATPASTPAFGNNSSGSVAAGSGVFLNQATLASGGGNISIIGTGSTVSSPNNAAGVMIEFQSAISSGTGTIAITGIGPTNGASGNMGVDIRYQNSLGAGGIAGTTGSTISSANTTANAVVINGTGSTSGALNSAGVTLQNGSSLISVGAGGGIVVNGTGGTFADNNNPGNQGISLDAGTTIDSTNGNVTLNASAPAGIVAINDFAGGTNTIFANASTGVITLNPTTSVNLATTALSAADLALTGSGTFTLTDASNAIGTLAGNVSGGNVNFIDNQSLTIGTVGGTIGLQDTSGTITVQTTGATSDITLLNNIAAAGNNTTVILAAGRNLINTGSATIGTGSGRSLIYSATPTNDVLGGLTGAVHYNMNFNSNPPGSVAFVGNQLLYSIQPNITFTADPQTMVYGANVPALTYAVSGLIGGDTIGLATSGVPSLSTTATSASGVAGSPYAISIVNGSLSSIEGYTFSFVGNSLTVTKAPLTISDNQNVTYGAPSLPALTPTATGLVNGDTLVSLGLNTSPAGPSVAFTSGTPASPVTDPAGTVYPITVTPGSGTAANYNITYSNGALTVTPAPLTITADPQNITYGASLPTFTVQYSGFVNGQNSSVVSGLTVAAPSVPSSPPPAGSYNIIQTGMASAMNYTITFVNGTLTVAPAPLTITYNQSIVYGTTPNFATTAANYTGFVNGENSSVVSGLTLTPSVTTPTNVGPYVVAVAGGTASNYTITDNPGVLTITPAPLTITPNNASTTYGTTAPYTVSYTGLVNGDTNASISGPTIVANGVAANANVGVYNGVITASGATATNYTISYGPAANLTITPANLTITANNAIRPLGVPNPTFTATYTTLLGGDTPSVITGLSLTTTATTASPVGTYTIVASGGTDPNYNITFADGTLFIGAISIPDVQTQWQLDSSLAPNFSTGDFGNWDAFSTEIGSSGLTPPSHGSRLHGNVFFDNSTLIGNTEPLSIQAGPDKIVRKAVVHVSSFDQNSSGNTDSGNQ